MIWEILNIFTCLDTINLMEVKNICFPSNYIRFLKQFINFIALKWSYDSDFILCSLNKRNIVQVFSLENPEWKCKIDEGSAGLIQVNWSPDSRHILTTSEFNVLYLFFTEFNFCKNKIYLNIVHISHLKATSHSLVINEQKCFLHEIS